MTKSELVHAYIRGDLDRRDFIKRLTAIGVSSGAAAFYATSLTQPAAAAGINGAGFVARAQPDEDYGLEVIIENLIQVISQILRRLEAILARLERLLGGLGSTGDVSLFSASLQDADADMMPVLETIRSQVSDHVDAMRAMFPDSPELAAGAEQALAPAEGTQEELLAAMTDEYAQVTGIYAALLPNLEELEHRQTMTQIAIVAGRHAAMLSHFADGDPVPASFEAVLDPATME